LIHFGGHAGAAHKSRQRAGCAAFLVQARWHAFCAGTGMTTEMNQPGASKFVALELSIQIVASLRDVVRLVRRTDVELARQIFRSASSISANLAEAGGREGKDRRHFFRIAAGSARETLVHLRVALAWGIVQRRDVRDALALLDRELAILWRLTH
jgi:four helix bundle protein